MSMTTMFSPKTTVISHTAVFISYNVSYSDVNVVDKCNCMFTTVKTLNVGYVTATVKVMACLYK